MFYLYRFLLSPAVHALGGSGFGCRYSPSCSHYAEEAFSNYPFFTALSLTLKRLLRCNPWINAPYFDPVPARKVSS